MARSESLLKMARSDNPSRRRSVLALLVLACALLVGSALHAGTAAAQPLDLPGASTNPTEPPREGVDLKQPYWLQGRVRPFLAAVFDGGFFFARSELQAGYGRPHYTWIGATAYSKLTLGGVTLAAGIHGQVPNIDISVTAKSFRATDSRLVRKNDLYYESDTSIETEPKTAYQSLDADLAVTVKGLGGTVGLETRGIAVFGVPDGYDVFEDTLRLIVRPPFVWQTKLTYLAWPGWQDNLAVGFVAELIGSPARDNLVFRTGPVVTVSLTDHLQAIGSAAFAIFYHDDLGLSGSDLGQIALRYRWASGEAWPNFP